MLTPTDPERQSTFGRFLRELSRRHVTRTAAIYAVAGLAVIEFADVVFPLFEIGAAIERTVILLVLAGFPVSLMVAWLFEVGSDGVQRRAPARGLRKWAVSMVGVTIVAMGLAGWGLAGRVGSGVAIEAVAPPPVEARPAVPMTQPNPADPEIEILAPAAWTVGGGGVFEARPKRSIRIEGTAHHSTGIEEVRANNRRLSVTQNPDRHDEVRFSGFVDPPSVGSDGEVEILAEGRDGAVAVRTFQVRTVAQPDVEPEEIRIVGAASLPQKRWAVIIGIGEYASDVIPGVSYADRDARSMYEFFTSPRAGMGGIPERNIQLLINEDATTRNIRSALTTFLRQSTPDDVIYLYIAAHGVPDPLRPSDLYILAHDSEFDDIAATAIPMRDVNLAMVEAYAYQKIVISDLSHSAGVGSGTGALAGNAINEAILDEIKSSSAGFVAFTSSEANQLSQAGEQYGGGHGVFTYYLLEGLRGAADAPENLGDGNGVVTLGEVMLYTRDKVRRETHNAQIPTISLTTFDRFWPMAAVFDQ